MTMPLRNPQFAANDDSVTFSRIALALADDYESIYVINTTDDSYVEYCAEGAVKELSIRSSGDNFYSDTIKNCRLLVHPEDQEMFLRSFRKENVEVALQSGKSFTLHYRLIYDGKPYYYFLKTIRGKGADDRFIIVGVQNVDAQVRLKMAIETESKTFGEIAKALARRYEAIYYVNILTDHYTVYNTSNADVYLRTGSSGANFFTETQKNLKKIIYPEDFERISAALEKQTLLQNMEKTGMTSMSYRLILNGKPQYVTLFGIRPQEDSDHIIVAVGNVDASMRREIEMREALGSAMELAHCDSMTGVKNKYAYAQMEMETDAMIREGNAPEFALVVCDINGLKAVNDTQGHIAGDAFIKAACNEICKNFKRSPVYRIGGDEFVVLLMRDDYKERFGLMERLKQKIRDNRKNGLVTVASGISEYRAGQDIRMQDVFERADEAMYLNKEQFRKEYLSEE